MNKTHLATAVILSAAFLFTGCKNESDVTDNQEEPSDIAGIDEYREETGDTVREAPSGTTDIYDGVLVEYSDMVRNDFYTNLLGTDAYDSSFGEHIGFEIRNHIQDIFYALYDIDGNGTMELIVAGGENGVSNPTFSPWNYDLYGYDGINVVHIFPEMEFGYRTNFSLYENGVIEVFYSGSAAESGIDFYKIGDDGFTPELVDSFASVAHLEGDEAVFIYSQNGNEITEEEYNAKIQGYEVTLATVFDWIQIQ